VGKFFRWIWWFIDASRRTVVNVLFLLIVLLVFFAFRNSGAVLQDKTVLVLKLKGHLVEQRSGSARETAMAQLNGEDASSTQLRDVLTVLDAAGKDKNIQGVLLQLDEFEGAGLPALRDVAAALTRFKAAGKKVTAWGSGFDQRQYFIAAQANEVYMHPMGMLFLQGFGGYRNYYKEALDHVGVKVNLLRVGSFKSAGEPFIADGPSPESTEASRFLYDAMWATYTQNVEQARKLPAGSLMAMINELPERLAAAEGDIARLAVSSKLVDGLKTREELREQLIERGARSSDGKTFRQVGFQAYLSQQRTPAMGQAVGVVVAEGAIVDGQAPAGQVGGSSTAELVRKARLDPDIRAVVLRVNSPGGSPFGSELIRHELELTRKAGKPVVVSMGDVAASGGYWISMAADEVMADAATVTGSIGVFALLPTADKALEKIGVRTAGVTTTWLGGAGDPRLPLDPRFANLLQTHIDQVYSDFTTRAAAARKATPAAIDAVAQGRVWTGLQAKERGLVDTVGGFYDALQSAAKRGGLGVASRVVYIEPERSRLDQVLGALGGSAAKIVSDQLQASGLGLAQGLSPKVARDAQAELRWLIDAADGRQPFATLAHCLCSPY
jgi:protease-4